MNPRAVSPVLGLALLLALTTVVAVALLVVGASLLGGTQSNAETQQVERSFTEFADSADRIAAGEVGRADYEVQGADDGSASVDPDAGSYEVVIERSNGTETLTSGPLGVYRFQDREGRTVAYQGGGVWRLDDRGEPQLVDPPPFEYRAGTDPTLTLPVVRLASQNGPASEDGTLVVEGREKVYPVLPRHKNPLKEGVVYVNVESEFCGAWQSFFEDRTDGSIHDACHSTSNTDRDEVSVLLSVPLRIEGVDHGIWTADADIHKNADVERVEAGDYDAAAVDVLVQQRREECQERGYENLNGTITEGGLHCDTWINDTLVVDTDAVDEDVDIYARDGMEDNNDITVVGDNASVAAYFDGPVDFGGGSSYTTIGNAADPTQTHLFFNSSVDFYQAGDGNIYGLVYAPESEFYIHASGSGEFVGAVVAETVEIRSASVRVRYDDRFEDVVIEEEGAGDPFYYLHVSETTLTVED